MASIETRKIKNWHKRFRVRWQEGGRREGDWDGETFDSHTEAKRFKGLVDTNLNRRPTDEMLVQHGFDYLVRGHAELRAVGAVRMETAEPAQHEGHSGELLPIFSEYAERFIDGLDHVLGYTKRRYRNNLRNHVTPVFGHLGIDQVEYETVQAWQRKMVKDGLSQKTIQNIRGSVIIPVLKVAAKPQGRRPALIQANPVDGLKLPPGCKKRRDVITSERWSLGSSKFPCTGGRSRDPSGCTIPIPAAPMWSIRVDAETTAPTWRS